MRNDAAKAAQTKGLLIMSKPDKDSEGTHLSFSPAHDSRNGPNHVDGQRWVDGDLDKGYGHEEPDTQHVGQSDGYGKVEADIPVSSAGSSDRAEMNAARMREGSRGQSRPTRREKQERDYYRNR